MNLAEKFLETANLLYSLSSANGALSCAKEKLEEKLEFVTSDEIPEVHLQYGQVPDFSSLSEIAHMSKIKLVFAACKSNDPIPLMEGFALQFNALVGLSLSIDPRNAAAYAFVGYGLAGNKISQESRQSKGDAQDDNNFWSTTFQRFFEDLGIATTTVDMEEKLQPYFVAKRISQQEDYQACSRRVDELQSELKEKNVFGLTNYGEGYFLNEYVSLLAGLEDAVERDFDGWRDDPQRVIDFSDDIRKLPFEIQRTDFLGKAGSEPTTGNYIGRICNNTKTLIAEIEGAKLDYVFLCLANIYDSLSRISAGIPEETRRLAQISRTFKEIGENYSANSLKV